MKFREQKHQRKIFTYLDSDHDTSQMFQFHLFEERRKSTNEE